MALSDSLIRASAVKNKENGSVSVAVINRNDHPAKINLNLGSLTVDKAFRKYLYDPENVPFNYFGDLQIHAVKHLSRRTASPTSSRHIHWQYTPPAMTMIRLQESAT